MIKILHSADWHLDAPLLFHDPEQARQLREALAQVPQRLVELCKAHGCQMMLLAGDLFDGPYAADTVQNLKRCLAQAEVPVFITPGNHDYVGADSPWLTESWPENVHIFLHPAMESVAVPALDCRVYGGGFVSMDCPGILEGFSAQQTERYAIGVLHGDPTNLSSPYCPITAAQIQESGFDYLALGHIHKGGSFRAGKTLCAWPGCPMGRGYDEQGDKGALIVTVDDTVQTAFVSLGLPHFYDLEVAAGDDPQAAIASLLPPVGNSNYYRITLTGPSEPLALGKLQRPDFPNLLLRDKTVPPMDVWSSAGEDTFEGMYFNKLQGALEQADEDAARQIRLAAQISRKILEGQEVVLP